MKTLNGLGVALITPFDTQGTVDFTALENIVHRHLLAGTDYLVLLGTTAETPTLSFDEKKQIVNFVLKKFGTKIPLVLGLGGNHTQGLIHEMNQWDLSPFEAVLSVTPYYNRPTQMGLEQHYKILADHCPKPLLLYNVPSRTGVNLLPQTVALLAEHPNIIGVKEAVRDTNQIVELIDKVPKDFLVISGDDQLAPLLIYSGGVGCISVIGNAYPSAFQELLKLSRSDAEFMNHQLFRTFQPLIDLIFREGNPAGIKALLAHLNHCGDKVRLPLVSASQTLQKQLRSTHEKSMLKAL
ncbi:MAG: 4-hydroxy-tetrahydrodipicolinate synthase [Flavobacteriaceae bacterium]